MLNAFHEGGWGMYPTFVLGLITLGTALRFAFRGDGRLLGFVESMTRAILFTGLLGFVTGMIMVGRYVEAHPADDAARILVQGAGEAVNNLALAFTMISLIHLVLAVGRRRVDAKRPAIT
jgi:hypothetical protein